MEPARVTVIDRTPRSSTLRPSAGWPLEALAAAFADRDAAEKWLDDTLRWLAARLGAERVELYESVPGKTELRLGRAWPRDDSERRLALEDPRAATLVARVRRGEVVAFDDLRALGDEAAATASSRRGIASALVVPLRSDDEAIGAIAATSDRPAVWTTRELSIVHEIAGACAAVLSWLAARRIAAGRAAASGAPPCSGGDGSAGGRPDEADRSHPEIVGRSTAIRALLERIDQVAATPATVLLLGETGTGKELVARAIHAASDRRAHTMVKVNCAALPATLVEAELFGREKGAYTGALSRQAGRFEVADGSTLFLDEIGELAPDVQVKLLRVLQEGEFERIGSTRTQRVNVRLIAATNRDLGKMVREGRFREDLYYRLNVFPVRVPALRERHEDVPLLVWAFVRELSRTLGRPVERIAAGSMELLERQPWTGNVRELRNVVERAMILHRGPVLRIDLPESDRAEPPPSLALADVERRHVQAVLAMTDWRIRGRRGAAELLGLKPTTLESRLVRLGISRPDGLPRRE